ncbi:hypothetical protein BFJ68_g760 [Fusarium oxysporum]|uniref:Uncharacterized protein n=1 Tax=Fusarium oxysporum TaxID=5507 RepID=A0A420S6C6_FUSOX|nr:hypothetical protein BFJ68_g760 [Fusarium oxysporum]
MDSAPLLQNADGLPSPNVMQDHPAFLRASHSPWSFIPQNILVILRGIVLSLVTAVVILVLNYEIHEQSEFSDWRIVFDFANISLFFVFLYQLKTFHMGSLRKQFYFTLFYTITAVFAFANSTIYFFIIRQHKSDDASGEPQPEPQPPNGTASHVWAPYAEKTPAAPLYILMQGLIASRESVTRSNSEARAIAAAQAALDS